MSNSDEAEKARESRLSQCLRLYVALHNLSQQDLAKEWELSPATVSRILKGETDIAPKNIIKIIGWLTSPSENL